MLNLADKTRRQRAGVRQVVYALLRRASQHDFGVFSTGNSLSELSSKFNAKHPP
jgi:hypothetical protein